MVKHLRGEVLKFAPLEAEKRAEQREIRWISLDGDPSSERMTNSKKCLSDICSIVWGETPVSMSDLSFRDPILLSLVNSVHALTSGRKSWRVMTRRKMSLSE